MKKINEDCFMCGSQLFLNEKYDSKYCEECGTWKEPICLDENCKFCQDRPELPPLQNTRSDGWGFEDFF